MPPITILMEKEKSINLFLFGKYMDCFNFKLFIEMIIKKPAVNNQLQLALEFSENFDADNEFWSFFLWQH